MNKLQDEVLGQLEFPPFTTTGALKPPKIFWPAILSLSEPTVRKSEIVLLDYLHQQHNSSVMLS